MKSLKSLLAVTVFAAGLGATIASAEIKLGLDSAPYPPFADEDAAGNRTGFEIELGNAICKAMGETCVWTPIAWDGIIPALNSKKIDAIFASMSITARLTGSLAAVLTAAARSAVVDMIGDACSIASVSALSAVAYSCLFG